MSGKIILDIIFGLVYPGERKDVFKKDILISEIQRVGRSAEKIRYWH